MPTHTCHVEYLGVKLPTPSSPFVGQTYYVSLMFSGLERNCKVHIGTSKTSSLSQGGLSQHDLKILTKNAICKAVQDQAAVDNWQDEYEFGDEIFDAILAK